MKKVFPSCIERRSNLCRGEYVQYIELWSYLCVGVIFQVDVPPFPLPKCLTTILKQINPQKETFTKRFIRVEH